MKNVTVLELEPYKIGLVVDGTVTVDGPDVNDGVDPVVLPAVVNNRLVVDPEVVPVVDPVVEPVVDPVVEPVVDPVVVSDVDPVVVSEVDPVVSF